MDQQRIDHAMALVTALHPEPSFAHMIQMTGLRNSRKRYIPTQRFFDDAAVAVEWALELNDMGQSVFVSVNPRHEMASFDTSVPYVGALFLDLQPERSDIAGVASALGRFDLAPSIIASSGNGAHFYFLTCPIERTAARQAARRLVMATNSDAVFNPARIARLPGSVNWKPNKVPTWCAIHEYHPERRYDFDQITRALDAMKAPHPAWKGETKYESTDPPANWTELRLRLSEHALAIIDYGERNPLSAGQGTRSEADWFVISELVRNNATDEDIFAVYRTQPIGSMKYNEAGDGYLQRTIDRVRVKIGSERRSTDENAFTPRRISRYSNSHTRRREPPR